jgi:hypothetical protein
VFISLFGAAGQKSPPLSAAEEGGSQVRRKICVKLRVKAGKGS